MQGIRVFSSLAQAEAAGFAFFDRTPEAILVRRHDGHTMAIAMVKTGGPGLPKVWAASMTAN
jgi:hypothetical protein